MAIPHGKHDEVARRQGDLAGLTVDFEPAAARGDDMEGGVAMRLYTEAPWGAHHRPAVDGAADPDHPQKLADLIGGVEVTEQFHPSPPFCS